MSPKKQPTAEKVKPKFGEFHQTLFDSQSHLEIVSETLRTFGFQQIFLPPIEDANFFSSHPELLAEYGNEYHEIVGPIDEGKILAPTQIYNLFKFYLSQLDEKDPQVHKWFYISPVPTQKENGFGINHEIGIFVLGENSPLANVQLVHSVHDLFKHLGIPDFVVEVNNIGTENCQKEYKDILESHLTTHVKSDDLQECLSLLEKGTLSEFLHCMNERGSDLLSDSPQAVDYLDEDSRKEFVGFLESLEELEIPYVLNPHMFVKPFQERTIFRFVSNTQDEPSALLIGGDYNFCRDHLRIDELPSVGTRLVLEDLVEHISEDVDRPGRQVDVFVISIGEQALKKSLGLFKELKKNGLRTAEAMLGNSGIKDQLKAAKRLNPHISLIIGQKEAIDDTVIMRDMSSGMQEVFTLDRVLDEVEKRLER